MTTIVWKFGGRLVELSGVVEDGPLRDIASEAVAPTASVFKIITATALIEQGLGPNTKQCYTGGEHSIKAVDLVDGSGTSFPVAKLGPLVLRLSVISAAPTSSWGTTISGCSMGLDLLRSGLE